MNNEAQLTLQAYLDGELPPGEQRAVSGRLASDPAARSLLKELEMTRTALASGELARTVPETREFYWSKVAREIGRQETAANRNASRTGIPWWRRLLVPAAGLAVLGMVLVLSVATRRSPAGQDQYFVDATLADPGAFTYRNIQEGVTLVWLSFPSGPGAPRGGAD